MLLRDNVYGSLEEDAQRRDFTVNALYLDIKRNLIFDFFNGIDDLKQGKLRLIGKKILYECLEQFVLWQSSIFS